MCKYSDFVLQGASVLGFSLCKEWNPRPYLPYLKKKPYSVEVCKEFCIFIKNALSHMLEDTPLQLR